MNTINLREADRLEVIILVDNYTDLLLENTKIAKRPVIMRPPFPLAEHGFSCLLKVSAGSEEHWVLLDAGISATCFLNNVDALKIDLNKIERFILSHGHFDHFGGLLAFLNRGNKGISLTLHPDVFLERRLNIRPMKTIAEMGVLKETDLRAAGVEIFKSSQASTLASNLIMVTGDVQRTTDFEKGFPWAEVKINNEWGVDPFHDDQAVAINLKGKGLVIIGGCSHSGIINTVRYAQKVTQIDQVHAIMGGFHLTGSLFDPIIEPTIQEIKKINPNYVVPTHCTGWKAINQFAKEMPEQFILSGVGTTFFFN